MLTLFLSRGCENSDAYGPSIYQKAIVYDWRGPNSDEFFTLGKIILENDFKVCGEYQIKKLSEFEYLLGCTPDGSTWYYRTVDVTKRKLYFLPLSITDQIKAPR